MDLDYWNSLYKKDSNSDDRGRKIVHFPSPFAEFCMNEILSENAFILELGTGNGRDAFYFREQGCKVHAVDQSETAIELNNKKSKELFSGNDIHFSCCDFVSGVDLKNSPEFVYSRFVFHAISKEQQSSAFEWMSDSLGKGSNVLIEARTDKDPLCGQGEKVNGNAYVCGHYRRFIKSDEFIDEAIKYGFRIRYFNESNGLAVYKDEDPVVMRVFLEKK